MLVLSPYSDCSDEVEIGGGERAHVNNVVGVFKTRLYSETKAAENFRDYVDFMDKVRAEPLPLSSKEAHGHQYGG